MNVLFLCQLPPPVHGASVVNKLIKDSEKVNHQFNCRFIDISPADEINSLGRISLVKLIKVFLIYIKVFWEVLTKRPDKVYVTLAPVGSAFYKDGLIVCLIKLLGIPVVLHLHGKGIKEKCQNVWLKNIYKFVFRGVDVIHLSDCFYEDIECLVPRNRFYVVNNGIRYIDRKEEKKFKEPVFLFLSNFVRSKGALELLKACDLLWREGREFKVCFAGNFYEEEYREEFYSALEVQKLKGKIEVFDKGVYGADKVKLLSNSDVMVLPTYNECFPITLIEAMANQMAIISTREGAIPDMVSDFNNGILVDKKCISSLAKAMKYLLDNPCEIQKMGLKGREIFEEKYTLDVFENNLIEVLSV